MHFQEMGGFTCLGLQPQKPKPNPPIDGSGVSISQSMATISRTGYLVQAGM